MRPKRRWCWTEKQLRRTRTHHQGWWGPPPKKWFCDKVSNKIEISNHKKALHNFVRHDKEYLHIPLRTYKNAAKWLWW